MEYPDNQRVRKAYEWLDTKLPWLPKVKDFVIRIVTSVVNRIGTLLFIVFAVVLGNAISLGLSSPDAASTVPDSTADYSNCNVLAIDIRNCIATYKPDPDSKNTNNCDVITSSEEVMNVIESAKTDDTIKAVLLAIDSTGGMPVAAEEIADAMKGLGKPSVAWVRGGAVSAAYWIASSADTIVAAENSDVGGIGITQSYVDNAKQNQTEGLTYNQLSTGLYKDTGSSDKPLTTAERLYLERDLNIMLDNFIRAVATNRNLSIEKVRALADGSSMLGAMALKNGLIDKLGTKQQVWDELEKQIGEKPEVCW